MTKKNYDICLRNINICLPLLGKPGGKPPFKPHNTEKGKTFKKSAGDGGPQKFNRKPADGKFTKKRKHPGSKTDGGTNITVISRIVLFWSSFVLCVVELCGFSGVY